MVHTGQTAHWIRYLNEDFILILSSSSPIKPDCSHMLSYSLMHVTSAVRSIFRAHVCVCNAHIGQCSCVVLSVCIHARVQRLHWRNAASAGDHAHAVGA